METKEQLINTIKDWVKIDNEIRTLQKEIKQRKSSQKKISESLIMIMKQNEIDCFDLNDGQICYNKKNVKKPITKGVLLNVLSKYYDGDFMKASELNSFIMENREEVTKETISRKINK
jgi:hypothetical protein